MEQKMDQKKTEPVEFIRLESGDSAGIAAMSKMATEIVREHFDPIIGTAQNDYMLARFQTEEAIAGQLAHGYRYYFVKRGDQVIGFEAFFPKGEVMYLSKFYLYKWARGTGAARQMLDFVKEAARLEGIDVIELNVNRDNPACRVYEALGFAVVREEKNDIGHGFFMDDYVYAVKTK